jgi:hypothetical protein
VAYRRSQEIERRLEEVLRLIRIGGYATPALAKALDVSIPTVSRCVTALRERGHDTRAEKRSDGWQYILYESADRGAVDKHNVGRQDRVLDCWRSACDMPRTGAHARTDSGNCRPQA